MVYVIIYGKHFSDRFLLNLNNSDLNPRNVLLNQSRFILTFILERLDAIKSSKPGLKYRPYVIALLLEFITFVFNWAIF